MKKKTRANLRNVSMKGSFFVNLVISVFFAGIAIFVIIKGIGFITSYHEKYYQQTLSDMQRIASAAKQYQNDFGIYPPDPRESGHDFNSPPPELVPKYLSSWPTPPCEGWHYEWVNPDGGEAEVVVSSPRQPLYHLCVSSTDEGQCAHTVGGPGTTSIINSTDKKIDCETIILK